MTNQDIMKQVISERVSAQITPKSQDEVVAMSVAIDKSLNYVYYSGGFSKPMQKILRKSWKKSRDAAKEEVRMQLGLSWLAWVLFSAALRHIVEAIFDLVWDNHVAITTDYEMRVREEQQRRFKELSGGNSTSQA